MDALLRHLHVKHAIYAVNRLTNKKTVSVMHLFSTYNVHIQDSFFYFSSFASTFDVKCVSKNCTNGPNPNALTKVPSPTIPPAR